MDAKFQWMEDGPDDEECPHLEVVTDSSLEVRGGIKWIRPGAAILLLKKPLLVEVLLHIAHTRPEMLKDVLRVADFPEQAPRTAQEREMSETIRISLYAPHTIRAGKPARCDEDCRSDDHVHLLFNSVQEATDYAASQERTDGAPDRANPYGRRVAASIRDELSYL